MTRRISRILPVVFHPFMVPIYAIIVLLFADTIYALYPPQVKIYLLWVVALYSVILPLLAGALLRRLKSIGTFSLGGARASALPLLIGTICYMLCAITLLKTPSLMLFRKMAVAAMLCELFCLVTVPVWRISTHLTAMGAATAVFVILNIIGVLSLFWALLGVIVIAGAVASARLYSGRNNGSQIIVGFLGGFAICTVAMLYF